MLGAIVVQNRTKEDAVDAAADGGDTKDLIMIVFDIKTATSASMLLPHTEARRRRNA